MGFRLRKRVKIIPGVTLNLGKTGVSISAGVRGARVTIGKTGIRKTVGIPGTGLSYTEHTKFRHNSAASSSCHPPSAQLQANITSSGALIAFGLLVLILFAIVNPNLVPVFIVILAMYFAWKQHKKTNITTEQPTQSQSVSLSQTNNDAITECARSMVRVVNESLAIANESKIYDTRISRIHVAKDTLSKLEELTRLHPEITLTKLDGVKHCIEEVERETFKHTKHSKELVNSNNMSITDIPATANSESIFWYDQIKNLKGEPGERLKMALKMLPLPAAFREAEVACRAIIRQKRKDKQEHENLLQGLYMLSALEGFCFASPYIEESGFPAYSVVELIPRSLLFGLHMPYSEIGYKHIPAKVTDIKWFVAAWGEPGGHQDPQKYHAKLWQDAVQNLRNKIGG